MFCQRHNWHYDLECASCMAAEDDPYGDLGMRLGELVAKKQVQYGNSVEKTAAILSVLYPEGIQPWQYDDALLIVRDLDKTCRIAERAQDGKDRGGESPWKDKAGYGLLGWKKDGAE